MNFSDVMQNLAVGIAGGIFSSVIVSVVFYVLNEYQNELNTAKKMTYLLNGIVTLEMTKNVKNRKKFNRNKIAKRYFDKTSNNFEKFEPCKFKYELKDAMCDIYEMLIDGKYCLDKWDKKILTEVSEKIEVNIQEIEKCERDFAKGFMKRVFRNKVIIAAEIVFIAIIFIA